MIETYQAQAEKLIEREVELERLADGFEFTEGPVWHFGAGHLTFSDIPADTMYRWDERDGLRVYRRPSNFSNGMTYDLDGALVVCEHRTRRVTREHNGEIEIVVDAYSGKRLNAPNDVIVAGDGSLIFTDPHYGLGEGFGGPAEQEQPVRAVYRIPNRTHEPELLIDDFDGPNGLALSADERTLYVDDSEHNHIRAFDVAPGWRLSGGDVLVEFPDDGEGVVDGLKLDVEGNLYCTGPGGVWLCSSRGDILGRISTPEVAANLAWGGDDARTMYVTASTALYRIRCLATGHASHRRR